MLSALLSKDVMKTHLRAVKQTQLMRNLLLVACSFIIALSACDAPAEADATATASSKFAIAGAKVGYVNIDSVQANYGYLNEQSTLLTQREQDATATLERKFRKFQEQVASFERRAQSGNMTPKAIENEQRALGEKQQELQMEQQRLAQEFQGEGMRLLSELTNVLQDEVKSIQEELGYDYILSYGSSSGVIAVNEDYDVTQLVLERMNAKGAPVLDTLATN